jgi:hypothetical protein
MHDILFTRFHYHRRGVIAPTIPMGGFSALLTAIIDGIGL